MKLIYILTLSLLLSPSSFSQWSPYLGLTYNSFSKTQKQGFSNPESDFSWLLGIKYYSNKQPFSAGLELRNITNTLYSTMVPSDFFIGSYYFRQKTINLSLPIAYHNNIKKWQYEIGLTPGILYNYHQDAGIHDLRLRNQSDFVRIGYTMESTQKVKINLDAFLSVAYPIVNIKSKKLHIRASYHHSFLSNSENMYVYLFQKDDEMLFLENFMFHSFKHSTISLGLQLR